jgi:hypothetical protein
MTAILLAFVCLSCGCAKYYYQEGKTLTECKQDFKECCTDLRKYQDPYSEPDPARYNISYDYEGKFLDTCMKEHGYKIVSEKKLPLKVKREDPDRWMTKTRGLAGKLDE